MANIPSRKESSRWVKIITWTLALVITAIAIAYLLLILPKDEDHIDDLLNETVDIKIETEHPREPNPVAMPEISEQLLTVNKWSRPGKKIKSVDKVVIHYLANPGTTAQENRDYFEELKNNKKKKKKERISMSANFVVGLEGEIIQCVPVGEIAYASNSANEYSVSIENCHPDESGMFTDKTYYALIHLTAWLVAEYGLDRDDIIRHYDVTGKECPLYYVDNEEKWEKFKDDVMQYIEDSRANMESET